jgi:hypothetical protein
MRPGLARFLIALMLALVVPIQGVAAATAGLCMAMGHHDTGTATHAHEADSDDHYHGESSKSSGSAHCAPCVACCAAAAISPVAPFFMPQLPSASAFAAAALSFSGIQPEQLDRPPLAL